MYRPLVLTAALLTATAPAFAQDDIYQEVVVIQTTTVTTETAATQQGFDTIEPAAGPTTFGQRSAFTPSQQHEYELHRYDDANYKG